jgi:hypothetical protein
MAERDLFGVWGEYLDQMRPVAEFITSHTGCTIGEAYILTFLHTVMNELHSEDEDDVRPGDEWKYE